MQRPMRLYEVWAANGFKTSGSWEEAFGKSDFKPDKKDWNYAKYVEKVVAAGKKAYPLPMYVNAWLKQPFSYWPGRYPSGGPLPQVLDVWRAAAPSRGILVDTLSRVQRFDLGDYTIEAKLGGQKPPFFAGGLIIQTGPQEFIAVGKALDIFFVPKDDSQRIGVNAVDEGTFQEGKWVSERRLNGDETHASTWDGTGQKFPSNRVTIQRISLYRYK